MKCVLFLDFEAKISVIVFGRIPSNFLTIIIYPTV